MVVLEVVKLDQVQVLVLELLDKDMEAEFNMRASGEGPAG